MEDISVEGNDVSSDSSLDGVSEDSKLDISEEAPLETIDEDSVTDITAESDTKLDGEISLDIVDQSEGNDDEYSLTRDLYGGKYEDLLEQGAETDESGRIVVSDEQDVVLTPEGDLIGPYDQLKNHLHEEGLQASRDGEKITWEAHHLVESRFLDDLGLSSNDAPSVALDANEHMNLIHGQDGVDQELPRGVLYDADQVIDGTTTAYENIGRAEWNEYVQSYMYEHRSEIMSAYEQGDVTGATEEDIDRVGEYLDSLESDS